MNGTMCNHLGNPAPTKQRFRVSGAAKTALILLFVPALATGQTAAPAPVAVNLTPSAAQEPAAISNGSISGKIVDQSGTPVINATVRLLRENDTQPLQQATTSDDGQYAFTGVPAGSYQLSVTGEGFNPEKTLLVLHEGETYLAPSIALTLSTQKTEVIVSMTQEEIATEQMKEQEQQRVLGIIPNFYISYIPDAAPLNTKQKFQLTWRTTVDPVSIAAVFGIAGFNQATDRFHDYGQGAQGYAKRLGAAYADFATSLYLGAAVFPAVFKQDPRYFYKGTGTARSRIGYAISRAVVCKGDNKRWQPCYSSILGQLASGGISNLYYPAADRGAGLTFENAAIGIAGSAGINILQEFVFNHVTSHKPGRSGMDPQTLSASADSPPRF